MAVGEKYKLSPEIVGKIRRERKIQADYAVPVRLQYLLGERIDEEEFFGNLDTQSSDVGMPLWWEREIPLRLSKREYRKELARRQQANRRLERQRQEIERASKNYISQIAENEKEFLEENRRAEELFALKKQELENLSKRQEQEYARAFYQLELELQRECQALEIRKRQTKGLKANKELAQEIKDKEELFAQRLSLLQEDLALVRAENAAQQAWLDALGQKKGLSAEFVNFTKTGLIYAIPKTDLQTTTQKKDAGSTLARGQLEQIANKEPESKRQLELPLYIEDDSWYSDKDYAPYKKDYNRIDHINLLEVKNLRIFDKYNYALLPFTNFFVREGKNSVVFCYLEEQADVLLAALTDNLQEDVNKVAGNIHLLGKVAYATTTSDTCISNHHKLASSNSKALKKLLSAKKQPLVASLLQEFDIDIKKLAKKKTKHWEEKDYHLLSLCLTLASPCKLKIYYEPTLFLDHSQKEILISLANSISNALFITSDEFFAANLKNALTFSI